MKILAALAATISISACSEFNADVKAGKVAPPGSYLHSCKEIKFDGRHLDAHCWQKDGTGPVGASLDTLGCMDLIRNMDGVLTCSKGDAPPPTGSYYQSCRSIEVSSGAMMLDCDKGGKFGGKANWNHNARIDIPCTGDLANINGTVICK